MVNVRVVNWRCIEDLELELTKLNIFMGKNSTGKSSLAHAIYFASKSRAYNPQLLITQLYGHGFDMVARSVEGKPQFPISVKIGDSEFSVQKPYWLEFELSKPATSETELEISKPTTSPWTDEFLLPSRRVGYFQFIIQLPKILQKILETESIIQMLGIGSVFKSIGFPQFNMFVLDYIRSLTGLRLGFIGEMRDIGSYAVNIHPLFSLIELTTQDPYTKLQLPAEISPDGFLDFSIFDSMTKNIPENSLVVIEEPEIHKNPRMVIDFANFIAERALDKKLTLIMTTHSDILPIAIAKLVKEQKLRAEDARIYYFKRDPWVKLSEIKFYEDGTVDRLPDTEEVVSYLF
ncbi:MAG: AAA family ATPase [Archaeoglobaceae archaeon]